MKNIIVKIEDEEGNVLLTINMEEAVKHVQRHFPGSEEFFSSPINRANTFAVRVETEVFSVLTDIAMRDLQYDFDQDELHHPCIPPDSEL